MASVDTASKEHDVFSLFERVRRQIRDKFRGAHELLQEREAALLAEVQELEDAYQGEAVAAEIKQLSLSKEQLESTLKGNQSREILEQSIALMDTKITKLQSQMETAKRSSIELDWDLEMENNLRGLGAIRVKKGSNLVVDYKKKGKPVAVFGEHKIGSTADPGDFAYPQGIAIDITSSYIYLCDTGNDRIQVFDKSFQFLFMFSGEEMIGPTGICILPDRIYVTQSRGDCLNIYSHEHKLLQSIGEKGRGELEFDSPRGLTISTKWKRIYICEFYNDRLQILNLDLSFHSFIPDTFRAKDVKVTPQEIVVLCKRNPCIQIYNYSHQLSRQMISCGEGCDFQLQVPNYLILDENLNILLTDTELNSVFIFSFNGELIHRFGQEGEEKGDFIKPRGIAMDSEGRIVVVSQNSKHCIQVF